MDFSPRIVLQPVYLAIACSSIAGCQTTAPEATPQTLPNGLSVEMRLSPSGPVKADEAFIIFYLENKSSTSLRVPLNSLVDTQYTMTIRDRAGRVAGTLSPAPSGVSAKADVLNLEPGSTEKVAADVPDRNLWVIGTGPHLEHGSTASGPGEYYLSSDLIKAEPLHLKLWIDRAGKPWIQELLSKP